MNYYQKELVLQEKDFINDELSPYSILNYFQNIAGIHADKIGLSHEELIKNDFVWVVLRNKYEIIKMPSINQKVILKTWPHQKGKIDFDREYAIYDENKNLLIKGLSKWILMNYKTRRISMFNNIKYPFECLEETNFENKFNKIEDFDINNFSFIETTTSENDLDINGHVNNASYARIVLNNIDFDITINHFEINYIKEIKANQKLKIYFLKKDNTYYIKAFNNEEVIFVLIVY